MNKLQRSISSLEVAEMVGRDHNEVLKDIRRIVSQLAEGEIPQGDYFTKSTYKDANSQNRPSFLVTKKGCELYGTRMTGTKGTQFAVRYIERFNAMEEHIQQQLPTDPVELALQTALNTHKQLKNIQTDVEFLKDSMRINGKQEHALKEQGKAKVFEVLGGYDSPAYKKLGRKVFSKLWGDFKRHFVLPRSMELAKKDFDEAVRFIAIWRPDTSMMMEIDTCNRQAQLKLVQ